MAVVRYFSVYFRFAKLPHFWGRVDTCEDAWIQLHFFYAANNCAYNLHVIIYYLFINGTVLGAIKYRCMEMSRRPRFASALIYFHTPHDTDGCRAEALAPLQIYNNYILCTSRYSICGVDDVLQLVADVGRAQTREQNTKWYFIDS